MNMVAVTPAANKPAQPTYELGAAAKSRTAPGGEARARALEQIYAAHAEDVFKFAYGKVGNREDAEDITSQVFVKAANWLDPSQDERQRLAWLYQVARTTVNDYWRKFYSQSHSSLEDLMADGAFEPEAGPTIIVASEDDDQKDLAAQVESILSRLPAKYAEVLRLRFLDGCSLQETADALGVTLGNARVMQYRALRKAATITPALGR
jgi:RNA polymerase sigma-70 factor (ECF subfamily)